METTDLDTYTGDKININKADVKELDKLWGIGVNSAKNIIAYREHNGPFQKIEDIMNVKYITQNKFDKFKEEISVGFEKPSKRTFEVEFTLNMASDSYVEDWAGDLKDSSEHKYYTYTLETDKDGNIIGEGEWSEDDNHPDFAWIPYDNSDSNGSENAYLKWSTLKQLIPQELLRVK
jgi:competence ComEA-like helix-hairpin-helix protein